MHVMIDEPDDDMDIQIATHIVKVHQRRERAFNVPYTMAQVQRYIRYARSIRPRISPQVSGANLNWGRLQDANTIMLSCSMLIFLELLLSGCLL